MVFLIACALPGASPLAQSEASAGAAATPRERATIDEVVVTARRVEERLQDTPVSVAVFSQDELVRLGTSELSDIGRSTAGLDIRKQTGFSSAATISMRGLGEGDTSLTRDPTVGVYVDGVYLARLTGFDFDIVDLQRIEVLRGPQGTLYGRNTIGGAINIITEKPRGEWAFRQQASAGSRDFRRFHTSIDTPSLGDLSAKLSFMHNARDGTVRSQHTGKKDLGSFRSNGLNVALNWDPREDFTADYAFSLSRIDSQTNVSQLTHVRPIFADPASPFYGGSFFETAAASASPKRQSEIAAGSSGRPSSSDIDRHTLTLEWEAAPTLTVKSITSYQEWEQFVVAEFGTVAAPADGSLCASPNPGDYDFFTGSCFNPVPAGDLVSQFESPFIDSKQDQISQEIQFIGSAFDDRLSYTAGLYYFAEDGREINPQRLVFAAPLLVAGTPIEAVNRGNSVIIDLPNLRYSIDNESYAAYSNVSYAILPGLEATLGLRFTRDEKKTRLTNTIDDELQTIVGSDSWSNFNPDFTLDYRWNEQLSTYARIATGYRSGGFNIRTTNAEAFSEPFDEENLIAYEIGWRSDLLGRTLRFNGAIFYMDYDDQQVPALTATEAGAVVDTANAGEARHVGAELELTWLPFDGMRLDASYAYVDIDFKEFLTQRQDPVTAFNTNPGVEEDISDTAVRKGPDHTGSIRAEYWFNPLPWGQVSLHVDANYTSSINTSPQLILFDQGNSHTLLNARATLSNIELVGGDLSIAVWGRNLTNKEFRESGQDFGTIGFAVASFGEKRSIGLDLIYDFNRR